MQELNLGGGERSTGSENQKGVVIAGQHDGLKTDEPEIGIRKELGAVLPCTTIINGFGILGMLSHFALI